MTDKERREAEGKETLGRVLEGLKRGASDQRADERVREAKHIVADEQRRGIGRFKKG